LVDLPRAFEALDQGLAAGAFAGAGPGSEGKANMGKLGRRVVTWGSSLRRVGEKVPSTEAEAMIARDYSRLRQACESHGDLRRLLDRMNDEAYSAQKERGTSRIAPQLVSRFLAVQWVRNCVPVANARDAVTYTFGAVLGAALALECAERGLVVDLSDSEALELLIEYVPSKAGA
jgi:hypothetical protein